MFLARDGEFSGHLRLVRRFSGYVTPETLKAPCALAFDNHNTQTIKLFPKSFHFSGSAKLQKCHTVGQNLKSDTIKLPANVKFASTVKVFD